VSHVNCLDCATRMAFKLSENEIWPGCREIAIEGELDLAVSGELEAALEHAVGSGQDVLVDLSACAFMDVSGLEVLLRGAQRLRARGHELLLSGAQDQVERLLSVTGYRSLVVARRRPPTRKGASQPIALAEAA
jgi:anti-anti-sigma factor